MSEVDTVRGWKDQTFRDAALIGEHPAGAIDTTDFHGGAAAAAVHPTHDIFTYGCCTLNDNCF